MNRRQFLSSVVIGAVGLAADPTIVLKPVVVKPVHAGLYHVTALIDHLLNNAIKAHDDLIEKAMFS